MQEIGAYHEKVRFARAELYAARRQIQRQGVDGAQCSHARTRSAMVSVIELVCNRCLIVHHEELFTCEVATRCH